MSDVVVGHFLSDLPFQGKCVENGRYASEQKGQSGPDDDVEGSEQGMKDNQEGENQGENASRQHPTPVGYAIGLHNGGLSDKVDACEHKEKAYQVGQYICRPNQVAQQDETDDQVENADCQSPAPVVVTPVGEGIDDFTDTVHNEHDAEIDGQCEVGFYGVSEYPDAAED